MQDNDAIFGGVPRKKPAVMRFDADKTAKGGQPFESGLLWPLRYASLKLSFSILAILCAKVKSFCWDNQKLEKIWRIQIAGGESFFMGNGMKRKQNENEILKSGRSILRADGFSSVRKARERIGVCLICTKECVRNFRVENAKEQNCSKIESFFRNGWQNPVNLS